MKLQTYYQPKDQTRLIAGQVPPGGNAPNEKVRKHLKYPERYIFRDFIVLHTGKLGTGAWKVLEELARIRRERVGPEQSKSVDAQVRTWARRITMSLATTRAKYMNDYYKHVQLVTTRRAIAEEEKRREDAERAEQQQEAAAVAAAGEAADAAALAAVVEQTEAEADQQQGALPVALNLQGGARGGAVAAADPGEAPPQEIEPEDPGAPAAAQPHHGGV